MKVYYYKNAGSLCVRIIANELDLKCSFESICELQIRDKITESGQNFIEISKKNQVPVLVLDDGRILTECSAIMLYLADIKKDKTLIGETTELGKYRVLEWLSYISSELHKNFVPIISPIVPVDAKPIFTKIFIDKCKYAEHELQGKDFVTCGNFTVADAYFFTVLSWFKIINIDIKSFPNLYRYFENLKSRPSVKKSLNEEGIIL